MWSFREVWRRIPLVEERQGRCREGLQHRWSGARGGRHKRTPHREDDRRRLCCTRPKGALPHEGIRIPPSRRTVHLDAATIVHPLQLVDTLRAHDGSVEIFATPGKVVDLSESPARRVVV